MIFFFNQVGPFYLSALVPFCLTVYIGGYYKLCRDIPTIRIV